MREPVCFPLSLGMRYDLYQAQSGFRVDGDVALLMVEQKEQAFIVSR